MPSFTVLRCKAGRAEALMIEPARPGVVSRGTDVAVIGRLTVPMSTRLVQLSPATLHIPLCGEVTLAAIVAGTVQIPGVVWIPDG